MGNSSCRGEGGRPGRREMLSWVEVARKASVKVGSSGNGVPSESPKVKVKGEAPVPCRGQPFETP